MTAWIATSPYTAGAILYAVALIVILAFVRGASDGVRS